METLTQTTTDLLKEELIDWISTTNDREKLLQMHSFSKEKFNFEEEFKKGITGEELKKRMFKYIDSLPWKK